MNLDKLQPSWVADLRKKEKRLEKLPRKKQLRYLFNNWFAWYEKDIFPRKTKKGRSL